LLGGARYLVDAQRAQALLHVRHAKDGDEIGIELLHHVRRRAGGREDADGDADVEAGDLVADRNHFRHERGALGDADDARLAAFHVRQDRRQAEERGGDIAGKHGWNGLRHAFVRHVDQVRAGQRLDLREPEVMDAAVAGRPEGEALGPRFRERDELVHGFHRQRRVHREE
jgi:hypothetical protein